MRIMLNKARLIQCLQFDKLRLFAVKKLQLRSSNLFINCEYWDA